MLRLLKSDYLPGLIVVIAMGIMAFQIKDLKSSLAIEKLSNKLFKKDIAALAKQHKIENKAALDFSNFIIEQQRQQDQAKLNKVLKLVKAKDKEIENLNDKLTLSDINVERLRDAYLSSSASQNSAASTVEHSASGSERYAGVAGDVRKLIAACAKTTAHFNACKRREQLVCGGKFPVNCTGEIIQD